MTPWHKVGTYHQWVWAKYIFHKVKVCVDQVGHPGFQVCHYEWRALRFQGQLLDNNPDCCRKRTRGHVDIGVVDFDTPKFVHGPNDRYVIRFFETNSPITFKAEHRAVNTAKGNFTLGWIGVESASISAYASITKITYTFVHSSDCGAGKVRVIWGNHVDPTVAKRLLGNCVTEWHQV
jgi:hypothetical protein